MRSRPEAARRRDSRNSSPVDELTLDLWGLEPIPSWKFLHNLQNKSHFSRFPQPEIPTAHSLPVTANVRVWDMDGSDVGRDVFVALRSFQNSSRAPRSREDEDKMEIAECRSEITKLGQGCEISILQFHKMKNAFFESFPTLFLQHWKWGNGPSGNPVQKLSRALCVSRSQSLWCSRVVFQW